MKRHALIMLLLLPWLAGTTWNLKPEYCNDDGVDEIPTFGGTRDSNNCLIFDPGNGDADVKFQYEKFHKTTVSGDCNPAPSGYERFSGFKKSWSVPDCDDGCASILVWDTTMDNYADYSCRNQDGLAIGHDYGIQVMWWKDVKVGNTWKCDKSASWTGDNGFTCPYMANDGTHVDGIQTKEFPSQHGWFVLQDSEYYNGYNKHGLWQDSSPTMGSVALQGTEFGRKANFLNAVDYVGDCVDGFNANGNLNICTTGVLQLDSSFEEVWAIDSWSPSNTPMTVNNPDVGKVVVVNTGCSNAGCGGSVGYSSNGWPVPIRIGGATGPGTCPNGIIRSSNPPVYCYTSLEEASADGHKLPPFVQYSNAGWASGAPGGSLTLSLDVSPNPVEVSTDFTLTATPNNGTSPYTVTWDCDADGSCDDGTPDSTSPYTQICSGGFGTTGLKTLKACVVDDDSNTAERTVNLTVIPVCGNNTTESPEVCDGTDLNGLDCTDQGYSGGTLACESDCTAYDTSSCTGAPSCGDDTCTPAELEEATFCFEDCAQFILRVGQYAFGVWNWTNDPLADGDAINYRGTTGGLNIDADPVDGYTGNDISGFRFLLDGSATGLANGGVQNSPYYAMCGDTGPVGIENLLPCDPIIAPGNHTLAVTPCDSNWTNTTPPILDGDCPGTLGPTTTINIRFVRTRMAD